MTASRIDTVTQRRPGFRHLLIVSTVRPALAASLSLALAACGTGTVPVQSGIAEVPGTVELNQAPTGDAALGGGGFGTLDYHGTIYRFAIGGLGVDGSEVAIIQTSGEVYGLHGIALFSGTYRRMPAAISTPVPTKGGLWLQNENATIMHLQAPPQGRMPDIGNDAVRVVLDQ
jgi:hypothetical protein